MQQNLFHTEHLDLYQFDQQFKTARHLIIAGIDEAGRGPLAGPVVAAAVILPPDQTIDGVNDSKQLSESRREQLYEQIINNASAIGVGLVDAAIIDQINILQATRIAMLEAVESLKIKPDLLLIDGITTISSSIPQKTIKKGDSLSAAIAAASIVAKVTRDRIMRKYDQLYPAYSFARHKGYGSALHLEMLRQHGSSPIHRLTFRGVK
jgi:ribonuclease HII